jgi:hypothetical protein
MTGPILRDAATPPTLADFAFDGHAALSDLIASSAYGSLAQMVASLTLFSHPDTVAQTQCKAVFPVIRDQRRRGEVEMVDGRLIGCDDNTAPTLAFMWCNDLSRRGRDLQFNHVWARSLDPDAYCALPNLCVTPSFLAKLTDTDPGIKALLRHRAYRLYGWLPASVEPPPLPPDYETLRWASPLPAVRDVHATVLARLARCDNRLTRMLARTGHLFAQALPRS